MAELKERGLKKSVGTAGLFATAYVLKVPEQLPLDGGLGEEERDARRVLEVARMQAKVAGCRVRCRLIRTRNPGRAIIDEATERRSDLIYISTEHAPSEERLLSPTTRYVLAHRPCRVVIEHDPTTTTAAQNGNGVVPPSVVPAPKKHSTRAKRGSSGRLAHRALLGAGGRAVSMPGGQSRVTTSSSSVLTGPWYLFFAETRYQTPKISGIRTARGT